MINNTALISLEELDLNQQQKVLQPEARKTIKKKSARRSKKCELMLRVKKLELRICTLEQTISSYLKAYSFKYEELIQDQASEPEFLK